MDLLDRTELEKHS